MDDHTNDVIATYWRLRLDEGLSGFVLTNSGAVLNLPDGYAVRAGKAYASIDEAAGDPENVAYIGCWRVGDDWRHEALLIYAEKATAVMAACVLGESTLYDFAKDELLTLSNMTRTPFELPEDLTFVPDDGEQAKG